VELVTEVELSVDTDPYLADHALGAEPLLPAVVGLEAMAQVAGAAARARGAPRFEEVRFAHPVAVGSGARVRVRIAALVRAPGEVEVALRSEATSFQVDHFRALCRFGAEAQRVDGASALAPTPDAPPCVPGLDPERDLYGGILFHGGRFRRLAGYRRLDTRACEAEIAPDAGAPWFGGYLPGELVLGDPGARDAALHAIQACIPHATLLPVGVERIQAGVLDRARPHAARAREIRQEGGTFWYDLEILDRGGGVVERWEGLRLRSAAPAAPKGPWAAPLLGPYLERRLAELLPGASLSVVVLRGRGTRRQRSDQAIAQALGGIPHAVLRRPDGRPEVRVPGGMAVSASHAGELTLAVAGAGPLGCDLELVAARPAADWADLLGPDRFALATVTASRRGEELDDACTRVWAAAECLKKAGMSPQAPIVWDECARDGWVLLSSGACTVATCVLLVREAGARMAVGLLAQADAPRERREARVSARPGQEEEP
jgi:enediyne polyketide synthase